MSLSPPPPVDAVADDAGAGAAPMAPGEASAARRRFRPEIEGLRAVAAILVAVYHVFLGRVSGGVDVFFVVAGFLTATTLLGHVRRSGGVAPGTYLSRLEARLLPMAMLVLVVVLLASIVVLPITRLKPVLNEIAASALYVENWALAAKQVDYLARGAALSPVQHFWALSMQGQFYLIWLGIFGTLALATRLSRRFSIVPLAAAVLGVVFVGSLAFSVYLTGQNQPLAYFHTGTRLWEFAAGGLVALALPNAGPLLRRVPASLGIIAGWTGLAMILLCGVLLTVSTSFPGYVALWPIVGGLLVIVAGDIGGSDSRWSSTRMLGSRPFVFLGGVSYAIYLWHWPILVLYKARTEPGPVPLGVGLLIIASAIGLAIITTYLVEQPVRTRILPRLRPWPTVATGALVMVLVAVTALGSWRLMPRDVRAAEIGLPDYPGAAAMEPGYTGIAGDVPFTPPVLAIGRDLPLVATNRCNRPIVPPGSQADWDNLYAGALADERCQAGDVDSEITVVLLGGSHAAMWFPAMEEIARSRGWHLISTTKSGCRLGEDPPSVNDEANSCRAWNAGAIRELSSRKPDLVVTTATVTGTSGEYVDDGAVDAWRAFEEAGIPVAAIRDVPRWPVASADCLALHTDAPEACSVARSRSVADVDPTSLIENPPANVTFIDLLPYLCAGDSCPAVIGNVVANYDDHHLSASFAKTLAPMLAERLPEPGAGD